MEHQPLGKRSSLAFTRHKQPHLVAMHWADNAELTQNIERFKRA